MKYNLLCHKCFQVCMLCKAFFGVLCVFSLAYLFCPPAYCNGLVNLDAVAFVESSGNPGAINKADNAGIGSYGLHQISPFALEDYNKAHKTRLKPSDLLKADTSTKVADWYLNKEIPRLIAHYAKKRPNIKDNLTSRLTAYNMGIGALLKGKVAKKYLIKYQQAKQRIKTAEV